MCDVDRVLHRKFGLVDVKVVRQLNRRTRFSCDEAFVVQDGQVDPYWLETGPRPNDTWGDTRAESAV